MAPFEQTFTLNNFAIIPGLKESRALFQFENCTLGRHFSFGSASAIRGYYCVWIEKRRLNCKMVGRFIDWYNVPIVFIFVCLENYAKRYLQTVRQQLSPLPAPPTADNLNKSMLWKTSKNQNINDHEATLTLLSLRKEVDAEFLDRSAKKILWNKIETGVEKCRQKFANLQSSFVKTNDKRKRTGEGRINNPPYFDELSDIFGDKHKTNPIMIIDSIAPTATASTSSSAEASSISPAEAGRSSPADAGTSYSAEKSTSLTPNRFAQIKSSVRQNKSVAVVEALKEINKANLEQRKEQFSQMMSLIQKQNEMRHEQILALIKSQDKKRKRGHSDLD
ncbi:hypothetical protein FQA39_LY16909 [Lamprigera yunnana]|nr:hypothetical protein FQA39_LY16909 [Lamprigera yunnana]